MKSVECYIPGEDRWIPIAGMTVNRHGAGIGVLDGVMYAIGGKNGTVILNSVEVYRPSSGIWTPIPDMHLARDNPGNGF